MTAREMKAKLLRKTKPKPTADWLYVRLQYCAFFGVRYLWQRHIVVSASSMSSPVLCCYVSFASVTVTMCRIYFYVFVAVRMRRYYALLYSGIFSIQWKLAASFRVRKFLSAAKRQHNQLNQWLFGSSWVSSVKLSVNEKLNGVSCYNCLVKNVYLRRSKQAVHIAVSD